MSITNYHKFKLKSDFDPAGDQPKAINDLIEGINKGKRPSTYGCNWFRENLYNGPS